MIKDEAEAILQQLEPAAPAGCAPWRDVRDGAVWQTGMKVAIQLSIAISLKRIADHLERLPGDER